MATFGYIPAPYEQGYYEGLFQAADVNRAGVLGGQEAVAFFTRSKLPMEVLKSIWTVADQPTSNSLDRRKFFTAVRLIQLAQNGQKAQGADLGPPPGVTLRPVIFEGVSGVSIPVPQQVPPQQQQQQAPVRAATPTMQQMSPPMQQQYPPSPSRSVTGPPPTPPRPHMQQQQQPPAMSTALTAQDPYSMPPQEQARYEGLFSQYAREDGFVYGGEAVALFSKSGLPQEMLRDIWNIVDTPVDNRLDKLEFAMAMHLIVCISKKNLPMPPGLPMSLKGLKSQQAQGGTTSPVMHAPPPSQMPGSSASFSSGMGVPPAQMGSNMSVSSGMPPPQIHDSPPSMIHAAPPIRPAGGMAISDAFEGISAAGGGGGMSGPPPLTSSSLPEPGSFASVSSFDHAPAPAAFSTIPEPEPESAAPAPPPAPVEKPKTSKELASSYAMGDNSAELEKLKTMLQRLQAENISLKASLGSMTEEEKEVQKEIGATVAEIGKLSNELTTLRAQVLAAKSALLEATAELKGHHEKKAMITDLISETKATKDAIDAALDGVRDAEMTNEQPRMNAAPPSYEADLFGGFDSPAPAAAPQQTATQAANAPPISTASTTDEEDATKHMSNGAPSMSNAAPAPSDGLVQTVMSSDDEGAADAPPALTEAPIAMFSNAAAPAFRHRTMGDGNPGLSASPSAADVEDAKELAKQAEQRAREAEETRRNLLQQADDLRKLSEQAENELREKESNTHHKRNPLRVGSKRKEMREVEKAKQDAAEKKKQFMELQTQASNAQALALETRREADRLRQEAEQTEIEAAQAASLAEGQSVDHTHMSAPAQAASDGGYGFPAQPANNGGFGGTPEQGQHRKQSSDYDGFGGGFGIMGGTSGDGAAWGIPSPPGSHNGDVANPW